MRQRCYGMLYLPQAATQEASPRSLKGYEVGESTHGALRDEGSLRLMHAASELFPTSTAARLLVFTSRQLCTHNQHAPPVHLSTPHFFCSIGPSWGEAPCNDVPGITEVVCRLLSRLPEDGVVQVAAPVELDGRLQLHDGGHVALRLGVHELLHRRVKVVDVRLLTKINSVSYSQRTRTRK